MEGITMTRRFMGITSKLAWSFGLAFVLVFFAVFGYGFVLAERLMEQRVRENAKTLTEATINFIDKVLSSTAKTPHNLAAMLEGTAFKENQLENWLRVLVEKNPEVYGSTVAFEPYTFRPQAKFFAPYYYKSGGKLLREELGGEKYNYHLMDWYQIPRELGKAIWSEPYFDEGGGGIVMATYSVPFFKEQNGKRVPFGVATADISLSWLQKVLADIRIFETGFAFLISRNGTFITHPQSALIMNETIFDLAEEHSDLHLRKLGQKMLHGGAGFELLS
jgi:sigma-B regulation protein RsbU (phosphoserine phosphatase)